ncbi:MAG TPA: pitrilysin family protein [Candidatus Polarisedimenticolia bacterium]|nr:pitrilysin family protein [Candidatus Polarisedimenticolia bacterium]
MSAVARTRLDNGVVLIARPNRAAKSVAIQMVFEAGAAFDPASKAGTAALVAGLLDRGAGTLSAAEIAATFDDLGIAYGAGAGRDSLEITLRLLSEHLPGVLERLRLIVSEPTFPEAEIGREKGRLLTAIAERDQNTAAVAEMAVQATLYPSGHPYRSPRLGSRDSVQRIERSDLTAFHKSHLRPSGAIVSMAGDFDPARAIGLAANIFGAWNGGPGQSARRAVRTPEAASDRAARPPIPDPPAPGRMISVVRPIAGKTQADIALGFRGLARRSPDLPAVLVLDSILGEFSLGGRLGKAIRERAGLAYYAYSHVTAGLGVGPFVARAGVAPERVRRALELMRGTIAQVVRRGVSPSELRDSKQALSAAVPRRMETNPDAAEILADAEFYGLGIDYPRHLPELIRAVTRSQVEEAARKYLTLKSCVLVVAGPAMDKETLA